MRACGTVTPLSHPDQTWLHINKLAFYRTICGSITIIKSTTYHQIWYHPKSTSIEQQGPWDPSNWAHPPRLGRPGHRCRPKLSKLVTEPCNGGLQTRGLPCCWEIMAYSQWLNHWMKVYYLYGVIVYMVVFQLGVQRIKWIPFVRTRIVSLQFLEMVPDSVPVSNGLWVQLHAITVHKSRSWVNSVWNYSIHHNSPCREKDAVPQKELSRIKQQFFKACCFYIHLRQGDFVVQTIHILQRYPWMSGTFHQRTKIQVNMQNCTSLAYSAMFKHINWGGSCSPSSVC